MTFTGLLGFGRKGRIPQGQEGGFGLVLTFLFWFDAGLWDQGFFLHFCDTRDYPLYVTGLWSMTLVYRFSLAIPGVRFLKSFLAGVAVGFPKNLTHQFVTLGRSAKTVPPPFGDRGRKSHPTS